MKSMAKQQAHEFKDRWKFVNDFIAQQIRNTPSEVKLQQLSAMFIIGQSRSPAFLVEEQEVRNRWRLLKQKTNVYHLLFLSGSPSKVRNQCWVQSVPPAIAGGLTIRIQIDGISRADQPTHPLSPVVLTVPNKSFPCSET